jgi:hypothetical protein
VSLVGGVCAAILIALIVIGLFGRLREKLSGGGNGCHCEEEKASGGCHCHEHKADDACCAGEKTEPSCHCAGDEPDGCHCGEKPSDSGESGCHCKKD